MTAVEVITKVLATNVLTPELTLIPDRGALPEEISSEESLLVRPLSIQHRSLLMKWNGIGLEVIRFFGCGPHADAIGRLANLQLANDLLDGEQIVAIASDASGFVYFEDMEGRIFLLDTDEGSVEQSANNIDDLVGRLVFGKDARQFAGQDWESDLKNAKII